MLTQLTESRERGIAMLVKFHAHHLVRVLGIALFILIAMSAGADIPEKDMPDFPGKGKLPPQTPHPGMPDVTDGTDPVSLHSGEFTHVEEDMRIPGINDFDFVWRRRYRSQLSPLTEQGNGWDYNYNIRVRRQIEWYGELVPVYPEIEDENGFLDYPLYDPTAFMSCPAGSDCTYEAGVAGIGGLWSPDTNEDFNGRPDPESYEGYARQYFVVYDGNGDRMVFHCDWEWTNWGWNTVELTSSTVIGVYDATARHLYAYGSGDTLMMRLEFPDGSSWHFYGPQYPETPTGNPIAGRIEHMEDRNGNTISFGYTNGDLTTITDTLGHVITVAYNVDGMIESVTDHTSRSVTYDYYEDIDAGGNDGDLESVTTPPITGAPNGNNFPYGKTTTYTYRTDSSGALAHNLISIEDGKGQTWLTNTYDSRDRVVQQVWGDGEVNLSYEAGVSGTVGTDLRRTIVNDRLGHVIEYYFNEINENNALVERREYTGVAPDPEAPTTGTTNRPVYSTRLRSSDPVCFTTLYEGNEYGLPTRIIHPNGNITEYVYDDSTHAGGTNVVEVRHLAGSHIPVGDHSLITEEYDYLAGFEGMDFVTSEEDGENQLTTYTYNATTGNRLTATLHGDLGETITESYTYDAEGRMLTRTYPANDDGHVRVDRWVYYDSSVESGDERYDPMGYQDGLLKMEIIDWGGTGCENLTTTYTYNERGYVIWVMDPRGNMTSLSLNDLDQIETFYSPETGDGTGIEYSANLEYDANDNITAIHIHNLDEYGTPDAGNEWITATLEYDILNRVTAVTREVDGVDTIRTEFEYDDNGNLIQVSGGEAVAGNQSDNVIRYIYDERNRLYQIVRGWGGSNPETVQFDYDGNGNVVRVSNGGTARELELTYDSQDRLVMEFDPMWNESRYSYDAAHNLISQVFWGEADNDYVGDAENERMAETHWVYDAYNRVTQVQRHLFDPLDSGVPETVVTTDITYSDLHQPLTITDDAGAVTTLAFDGVGRLESVTDDQGNSITRQYDANSNVTQITRLDVADSGAMNNETFVTQITYDYLNRPIFITDNDSNTTTFAYDSRSNVVSLIDRRGNASAYDYDGLSRLVQVIRDMDSDGADGDGTDIVTSRTWDESSRLVEMTDDNGNTTEWVLDGVGRVTAVVYADGTQHSLTYNSDDDLSQWTDPNGSVVTRSFDLLGQVTSVSIVPGAGVATDTLDGTTWELYSYDGLGRLRRGQDNDSLVTFEYDSLGRMISETLNGYTVDTVWDTVDNLTGITYPGGTEVTQAFDSIHRLTGVSSDVMGLPESIATYSHIGRNRVEQRNTFAGTRSQWTYDAMGRPETLTHDNPGLSQIFDDWSFAWDAVGNRVSRSNSVTGIAQAFTYDDADRLVQSVRDYPDPTPDTTVTYALDGVHNRSTVTTNSVPETYLMLAGAPENDYEVNQYTQTPSSGYCEYDENGNLLALPGNPDPPLYDYRNQMVRVIDPLEGGLWVYRYDVLGRRIARTIETAEVEGTLYLYQGDRVIEERDAYPLGGHGVLAEYVYGRNLDEPVLMWRDKEGYLYHTDDLMNVTTLTNVLGEPIETYRYDDFGYPHVFNTSGTELSGSAFDNPYLWNGRRWDPETELYWYRTRYMEPRSGRFTSRDVIGLWGDPGNLGNATAYLGHNPWSGVDPYGLTMNHAPSPPPPPPPPDRNWMRAGGRPIDNVGSGTRRFHSPPNRPHPRWGEGMNEMGKGKGGGGKGPQAGCPGKNTECEEGSGTKQDENGNGKPPGDESGGDEDGPSPEEIYERELEYLDELAEHLYGDYLPLPEDGDFEIPFRPVDEDEPPCDLAPPEDPEGLIPTEQPLDIPDVPNPEEALEQAIEDAVDDLIGDEVDQALDPVEEAVEETTRPIRERVYPLWNRPRL